MRYIGQDDEQVYLKCSHCKKIYGYPKATFRERPEKKCDGCGARFKIIWFYPININKLRPWFPLIFMSVLSIFIIFIISLPFLQKYYIFNKAVTSLNPVFASILIPALCSFISIVMSKWSEQTDEKNGNDSKVEKKHHLWKSKGQTLVAIIVEGVALIFIINIIIQTQYCSLQITDPDTQEVQQYFGSAIEKVASGDGRLFDSRGNLIYIGGFKNDLYNGYGKKFEWIDVIHNTEHTQSYQCTYMGEFIDGLPNGQGCEYLYDAEYNFEKEENISPYLHYEGQFVEGVYCGYGTLYGITSKYEGVFFNGQYNGYGQEWFVDKTDNMIYKCEGMFSDGCLEGEGKKYYSNGNIYYEGTYKNNYLISGTSYFKDGNIRYEGEWKENQYDGSGTLYWNNGKKCYEGEWSENKRSGRGTSYREDETMEYIGQWKEDQYSGYGKLYYDDGVTLQYDGRYSQNNENGLGKSYYRDGTLRYDGNWKSGKWEGFGTWYWENGIKFYVGNFENDQMHGEGTTYWENDVISYEGTFEKGVKSGVGISYSNDHKQTYHGDYSNDMQHGFGTSYWPNGNTKYEGNWSEGKYSGQGKEWDEDGKLLHDGIFSNGEFVSSSKDSD